MMSVYISNRAGAVCMSSARDTIGSISLEDAACRMRRNDGGHVLT